MKIIFNTIKKKGKCLSRGCKNRTNGKLCGTCRAREWKIKNPEKYAFQNLKSNAKRRGKVFELTFEDFKAWCVKTEYLKGKGRTAEGLSVDRIDATKGYTLDNIQVLTQSENVKKKYLDYNWMNGTATVVTVERRPIADLPF